MVQTRRRIFLLALVLAALAYLRQQKQKADARARFEKASLVFIVTGGGSGIGRHMTERLLAKGHKVVSTDINEQALKESLESKWKANGDRISILKHDVRSPEDWMTAVDLAVQKYGKLDVLLNIAGYIHPGSGVELDVKQIDMHIDINTKGMIIGSQVAAQQMLRQGYGHIVNIASTAGVFFPPGLALYAASKHGIRGYTRSLAAELYEKGITVSCLCPDAVQTPMLEKQYAFKDGAITFSSPHMLTVNDIEDVIMKEILPLKLLEVVVPRPRGWVGALQHFIPDRVYFWLVLSELKRGRVVQHKMASGEK